MNGMYLSFFIFTQRFMKLYKVVSKTTLELYCYKFLRVGLQCTQQRKRQGERGNRGYQGLLSVAQQPSPPPSPPHTRRVPTGLPGAALSEHILPPPL